MNKNFKNNGFFEVIISLLFLAFLITILLQKSTNSEYTEVITIMAVVISLITVLLSLMKYFKDSISDKKIEHYKTELELKEYDMMREHLEKEITQLQKKLINSTDDWENINHLPLSAQKKEYDNGPIQNSSFIKRFGLSEKDASIDKKMVFLLTPFSNESVNVYLSIKNICSECGLNLYRGDEEFSHEDILANIIKYIVKSRIVIANIDGKNPNVFYELGIAHTLGKPTILVSKSIQDAPFDIQQNRIVLYENNDDLKLKLSRELSRILVEH